MRRFLLGALIVGTLAIVQSPLSAQDNARDQNHDHDHVAAKVYYDRVHKEKHEWNDHEETSWNSYREEHHIKTTDFARTSRRQQQDYWNWRHEHPDSH